MTVSLSSRERVFRKQRISHKLIALCSFKEVRENFSEERQFLSMSISQIHFASGGFAPGPPMGLCPYIPLGASAEPRPLAYARGPPAPSAVYFHNISAYLKSHG